MARQGRHLADEPPGRLSETPHQHSGLRSQNSKFHFTQIRLQLSSNENTPHLGNPAPNGTHQVLCMRCDVYVDHVMNRRTNPSTPAKPVLT